LVKKSEKQDKLDIINTELMFGYLNKLQKESIKLHEDRNSQEKRLIDKKKKVDKIKLEIADSTRKYKTMEDEYKKKILEINTMLINKDAESQVIEKKIQNEDSTIQDSKQNKNIKLNKLDIYEEEVSRNKTMKSKNVDLNKKFKIMQELVMNKYNVKGDEF